MNNNDYVICETYRLPSQGKIYNPQVNENVKMRSMTTNEEMKRLGKSDRQYKIMADIIDDCLVEGPGISAYDLCLGDYQYLLHKLRVVTYGSEYKLSCKCPFCAVVSDETLNLDDIPVLEYQPELEDDLYFQLPVTKKYIKIRMQTPRDLDDIKIESIDYKKRFPKFKGDSAFLFTLKHLITEIDNRPVTFEDEDWLKNLPLADGNYILRKAEKAAAKIGEELEFEIQCPICGLAYTTPFRITPEFFGPGIDD